MKITEERGKGLFFANIIAIVLYILAGILCLNGIKGWGWFLIVGVCFTVIISDDDKETKEKE